MAVSVCAREHYFKSSLSEEGDLSGDWTDVRCSYLGKSSILG